MVLPVWCTILFAYEWLIVVNLNGVEKGARGSTGVNGLWSWRNGIVAEVLFIGGKGMVLSHRWVGFVAMLAYNVLGMRGSGVIVGIGKGFGGSCTIDVLWHVGLFRDVGLSPSCRSRGVY